MSRLTKGKKTIVLFVSLLLSVALIIAAFFWFGVNIDKLVTGYTEAYLKENVNSLSLVFESKITDQQIMLESQARYFRDVDLTRYNDMKATILSTKGVGSFKTIGVASTSGTTLNYNGESSGNILLQDYFINAMAGNNSISNTSFVDEDGDSVVAMAVPIIQRDEVIGAVFGTFNEEILSELLNTSDFGGKSTNILLDKNGGILARSRGANLVPQNVDNFLTAIGHEDFDDAVVDKMFDYNNGTVNTKVILTEVGNEGWYFGTIINEEAIDAQEKQITQNVLLLSAAITFAMLIILGTIVVILRESNRVNEANKRFLAATEQNKDIIFEYTFATQTLSVDGYVKDIFPEGKREFLGKDMEYIFEKCHPDDECSFMKLIDMGKEGQSKITGEFRVLNNYGQYNWMRVNASMKYNLDDTPYKMVGTFINADEQHERELLLKEKAELDSLTGIYNKGIFREKVSFAIGGGDDNMRYALYIVDLDFFKAVNDNLGHAMGDQVLMDVAKKLCLVFSERDIVGRIGGDEFAVLLKLEDVSPELAERIIDGKGKSVCKAIKETYSSGSKSVTVSASVGVAVYPDAGTDYDTLFSSADEAMYSVKMGGKNSYRIKRHTEES